MSKKKKLFLTTIAKEKNMPPEEVLASLIPHDLIYAHVENVTLTNYFISKFFLITDLPIPEMNLNIIWSRGAWKGNRIQIRSFDVEAVGYHVTEAMFDKDIHLSLKDLFVYEHDLVEFEKNNPKMFAQKPTTTPTKEEEKPYSLIGILVDMLVDKKGKNTLPLPTGGKAYIFKNQADLIAQVEKYEFYGLKKSSLEAIFGKANSALISKTRG